MRSPIYGALLLVLVLRAEGGFFEEVGEDVPAITGMFFLKTIHEKYVGHVRIDEKDQVALVPHKMKCEQWTFEYNEGKVELKPYCNVGRGLEYLRASAHGAVTVGQRSSKEGTWTPVVNTDGSWSFKSGQGRFLSADKNGSVYTVKESEASKKWHHFWLESADPPREDEEESEDRKLSAEIAGRRTIKSWYHGYLRAWANATDWFVGGTKQNEDCERWTIEDHKGTVALKAYCSGHYLRANPEKYVDLADHEPLANEMWTPVKNDDGTWSFQSLHIRTWLRAQPHGRFSLQTGMNGGDEKFTLGTWTAKVGIHGERSIKSTHDKYLRAEYCNSDIDATNVDTVEHLHQCEKWKIQLNGKKVSLMPIAEPGKYLRAYQSGGSVGLSKKQDQAEERELWTPVEHSDGTWSLKSTFGKLLSADAEGKVTTVSGTVDTRSERFTIEEIKNDE